jgi:hypothetical protein
MKKVYLEYEGYLTNSIEETIKYTEYISENVNTNFKYTEYITNYTINSYNKLVRIEKLKKILNII